MKNLVYKTANNRKGRFIPNMANFEVSLSYEGIVLKRSNERMSISELKRKYSRKN